MKRYIVPLVILGLVVASITVYSLTLLNRDEQDDNEVKDNREPIITKVIESEKIVNKVENEENTPENEPVIAVEVKKINPSTRIVFQEYYLQDETLEATESEPAYNLLQMTREELQDYYKEWQILYFNDDRVILRKSIDDRNPKGYYIVKIIEGKLAVYYDYTKELTEAFSKQYEPLDYSDKDFEAYEVQFLEENKEIYLREIVDMPISILSEEELYKLEEGISIYGEEELIKLLENYTS